MNDRDPDWFNGVEKYGKVVKFSEGQRQELELHVPLID